LAGWRAVPELPEVEVVRAGLAPHITGRRITSVDVEHARAIRRHAAGAADFAGQLAGQRIEAVRRRGKYLWLALDSGDALLAHLGMSGQILIKPPETPAETHLRVRLALSERATEPPVDLRFVDQRTFGGLAISPGGAALPPEIAHIGRDLLDPALDPDTDDVRLWRALRARHTGIKRALLDQRLISGVGNIYADEALWAARLHYARPTDTLRRAEALRLFAALREVFTAALRAGGTSFDALYVNVNGESGYFERSLNVYGREGEPCHRCGTPIRRHPFMNRSSYVCPTCQPRPRRAHW
jgi:formamidopyrimidine-DNA glycosylase